MNYNDFPILSNNEYNLINKHYSILKEFNRKDILEKICCGLSLCNNFDLSTKNKYNSMITKNIKNSKETTCKIYDNLTNIFNISNKPNLNFYNLDIISYLKSLVEISKLFLIWIENERKEYYKSVAIKNNKDILCSIEKILSSINDSNIFFFKFM